MSSSASINCPKCGGRVTVVGWYYVKCTNPNCDNCKNDILIRDDNIDHD